MVVRRDDTSAKPDDVTEPGFCQSRDAQQNAETIVQQATKTKVQPNAKIIVQQDDETRPILYLVFLVLTLIMFQVWWWTTAVPRAALSFPSLETLPLRLPRLSTAAVQLVNLNDPQWDLDELRISPMGDETHNVAFEETVLLRFAKVNFDESVDSVEELAGLLVKDENDNIMKLFVVEKMVESGFHIWMHPSRRIAICTGAALHPEFHAPQQFLESIFSTLFQQGISDRAGVVPDAAGYQITFTLVVGQQNESRKVDWQMNETVQRYFMPLVGQLRRMADIKVHFQIKSFAELHVEAVKTDTGFLLQEDQLPIFVNENQWNVATSISDASAINFIVFVPPSSIQPLGIDGTESLYFGYRQWGGVYILNSKMPLVDINSLKPAVASFLGELRRLFGLNLDSLIDISTNDFTGSLAAPRNEITGITPFETDLLMTRLLQTRMLSTVKTLQSLERLLAQNSEIVVLPAVGSLVRRSAELLRASQQHLSRGRSEAALMAITQAMQLADAAFFHPTMMAHQYFPDEHKLGVYLPLFFPFILPIAIATLLGSIAYLKTRGIK
ncbi:hypothetical protein PSACC_01889 [Paramicrosporidium saccamoebae]|uniref:GPI transamidase component PIG-S n=1 Tax=Paramicrosporidium saccamoebae TaxID=1246581 RepID=A0A2H9TKK0_9FUNG|nr:hypothetical protein PSACC_01889 [Paramicrosporidium saccamoebae]